jgi:glyoxylase-like metal-dependent hydrolase (beta-lactamase superfamily II)
MLHRSKKLFDNLFCYIWSGHGNNSHTYLFPNVLRGERPHVIVDPGFLVNETYEGCIDSLTDAMGNDGFKMEDIGLIINTHTHPDHCQATETIVERSARTDGKGKIDKAIVALTREADDYYRVAGERMSSMFGMKAVKLDPLIHLVEGDLSLGRDEKQVNLTVFHTPGHSPGSICIYSPDKKALITGDLVFNGSVGRTDFPGGSITTLKQSIERVSQLDVEYLLPGHSTEMGSIIEGKRRVEQNFRAIKFII